MTYLPQIIKEWIRIEFLVVYNVKTIIAFPKKYSSAREHLDYILECSSKWLRYYRNINRASLLFFGLFAFLASLVFNGLAWHCLRRNCRLSSSLSCSPKPSIRIGGVGNLRKNISKSNQSLKVMFPVHRTVPDWKKVSGMLSHLSFRDGSIVREGPLGAAEKPLPCVLHCLPFLKLKIWKL